MGLAWWKDYASRAAEEEARQRGGKGAGVQRSSSGWQEPADVGWEGVSLSFLLDQLLGWESGWTGACEEGGLQA